MEAFTSGPEIKQTFENLNSAVTELRRASFALEQELWRGPDCLLRAQVRIACLYGSTFKPRALGARLAAAIEAPLPATALPLTENSLGVAIR